HLPRFAYFPFGGGPRQCIGNAFAMMEAVLILAAIAHRFRLVLVPGQHVTPTPYVTLRPEPGIRVRLERR
ncbi:MAG TPA: cytochrome P450, partial [Candidatus Polarisedimenticolia bacterium]|nr:cytochrome P450 [Candidatus Polarisedimenticolia bacterium]